MIQVPAWVNDAACDPDGAEKWWRPISKTSTRRDQLETQYAVAVCWSCPVRALCLQWALANGEKEGVWGGYTPEERMRLNRVAS